MIDLNDVSGHFLYAIGYISFIETVSIFLNNLALIITFNTYMHIFFIQPN